MDEIRNHIRIVFQHYTSFGDRKNMTYIQSNKVQKLMTESGVIGKKVTKKDIDILFLKINKSKPNMYFEDFIKLLYEIATLKYEGDQMDAFKQLLDDHIFKRLEEIGGISKKKPKEVEFDELIEECFVHVINLAYDIYHSYFTLRIDRVDKATDKEVIRCEKYLFEFLRDFELCPKQLSKSKVYTLWHFIIECSKEKKGPVYEKAAGKLSKNYDIKEENKLFTFAYFLDFLVLLGNSIFIKKGKKVSNAESVVLLLERMEISEGFSNFEQKMHRTQSSSSSLLPPKSVKDKLAKRKPKVTTTEDKDEDNLNKILTGKSTPWKESSGGSGKNIGDKAKLAPKKEAKPRKASDSGVKTKSTRKATADSLDDNDGEFSAEVKELIPRVKGIFEYYCAFGEPGNKTKLKTSMFQKLLKEAKIIK